MENIAQAIDKLGLSKKISKTDMQDIMKAHDIDNNGFIDYEEFKRMIL